MLIIVRIFLFKITATVLTHIEIPTHFFLYLNKTFLRSNIMILRNLINRKKKLNDERKSFMQR
jgi:hypothetical protein